MCKLDTRNKKKPFEINLLSNPKVTQKWIPQFFRGKNHWKIFSGRWELESPNRLIYLQDQQIKTGENISIIGSHNWNEFIFQVSFRLLTGTLKPPEGGIILYFLLRNIKNYYSFHFCLFKQKIELIKRFRGNWSIIAEHNYDLETQKDYWVRVSTKSGCHLCQIDGTDCISNHDMDISRGCVGIGVKYCDAEFNHISISIP